MEGLRRESGELRRLLNECRSGAVEMARLLVDYVPAVLHTSDRGAYLSIVKSLIRRLWGIEV